MELVLEVGVIVVGGRGWRRVEVGGFGRMWWAKWRAGVCGW